MFTIVDIETTGGYGTNNCIIEIAIVLFDGKEIEGRYHTLINPETPIQKFVQTMTGITNEMVKDAPKFKEVAEQIYNLISKRVFIAHNVNFDYSFVKQHLSSAGFEIDLPKICTIKLTRKIFPGLPKYGLGSLSNHFKIKNKARHRAAGDAEALYELFLILKENDINGEINLLTKKRKSSQFLPPNLPIGIFEKAPSLPGVYYFHNKKGKIIYVGKAINLKKRISSHFSNNKSSKQKQELLKETYNITWTNCSSELTACVFESIEIKRLWPSFNKSQKHYERQFGIFMFEDSIGYLRLAIDNKKKILKPLQSFALLTEARNALFDYCKKYNIEPWLFFLTTEQPENLPSQQNHNSSVNELIQDIKQSNKTYLIHDGANTYFLVEEGIFIGMGTLENINAGLTLESIKKQITLYSHNLIIKSYLNSCIEKNPENLIYL